MGWSGNFQIKYKGDSPKAFHKLAKMIIPNSIMRFDFDNCIMGENSALLSCTRSLSWPSADADMQKLINYLSEGDYIAIDIDGEMVFERVEIFKKSNEVCLRNPINSNRIKSDEIGIPSMLLAESVTKGNNDLEQERLDVCSLDGYVQLIANTFAEEDALIPVVQDFMYTVLDPEKVNESHMIDGRKLSSEDYNNFSLTRSKFNTVESTACFLKRLKKEELDFSSNEKEDINDLPEWAKIYPLSVINALGGVSLLKQLIAKKGERAAREMVDILGGGIMQEMTMKNESSFQENNPFGTPRR